MGLGLLITLADGVIFVFSLYLLFHAFENKLAFQYLMTS